MAVKILSLGGTDWANGDVLTHTDLIDTIEKAGVLIHQVYTGTGFDNTGIADTDEHELTAITNTTAAKYTYARITINTLNNCTSNTTQSSTQTLTIQSKETGGAYGDIMASKVVCDQGVTTSGGQGNSNTSSITWNHTITAGEKTNGFQIKIKSAGTGTDTSTLSNIQTVVELI